MTRRRRAPIARPTSDVGRFRGLFVAAAASFVAVIAGVFLVEGGNGLVSPGPLARPHELAGLECAACHAPQTVSSACSGCHGSHRSARAGHELLRVRGELPCETCHAMHRAEHGLAFLPTSQVLFYGTGFETDVSKSGLAFRPRQALHVPLIGADRCGTCHDPSSAADPAFACLGGASFSLCFDEHGGDAQALRRGEPGRTAAVEAARQLLVLDPQAIRPRAARLALSPVVGGLSAAVLLLVLRGAGVAKWLERFRKRAAAGSASVKVPAGVRRLPVIDATTCLGCSACVDVCPYDVFEIRNYVAVVARPDDCCGLVSCQERCPNGSLVVQAGKALDDRPALGDGFEVLENPGIYLAGDVTGLPLIRVAVEQGAAAARTIARSFRVSASERASRYDADLVVIGAGPAGLAAALEAQALGLRVIALEQGKIAESIQSFPRGKLILDRLPSEAARLPLWLGECTKEELVVKWLRTVRRSKLDVREGQRVTAIERHSALEADPEFEIRTTDGALQRGFRAARVVLAIGRRGTPRKLPVPIPPLMQGRVHYTLSDARSFRGQRLVIVGLGDSAMEAAQALARQPGNLVTVCSRAGDFRRGKLRNIETLRRLSADGSLELIFDSEVEAVGAGEITLRAGSGRRSLACDVLFVMIGSIPSATLLEQVGFGAERGVGRRE